MPQLTQDQARALAEGFLAVSKAVGDFRLANFSLLTPDQQAALRDLQQQLSNQSLHFTAVAIQITLDDLQGTLERIGQVTAQVNQAVTNLNDIRRVITVATSFVGLGAAIASGNPGTIATAVQGTIQAVAGD